MHSIEITSQRSLQATLRSGTLNLISVIVFLPLLKNKLDLQALVEGVKIGLAKDQSQYRYQKRESYIVKFLQTTQRFIKTYANFSHLLGTHKGYHDFIKN